MPALLRSLWRARTYALVSIGTLGVVVGASATDVVRLVLGEGLVLVAMGLTLGMIAVIPMRRLVAGLLFRVGPFDPLSLLGASVLLSAVAFLACYLPARRAAQGDLSRALRHL